LLISFFLPSAHNIFPCPAAVPSWARVSPTALTALAMHRAWTDYPICTPTLPSPLQTQAQGLSSACPSWPRPSPPHGSTEPRLRLLPIFSFPATARSPSSPAGTRPWWPVSRLSSRNSADR
jgi:hypothetical protein